ncbi:hypothetical protein [Aeromonas caviae]|jgi:hypothetical protein|nr:hypothetical protein [Aeromonas caviae]
MHAEDSAEKKRLAERDVITLKRAAGGAWQQTLIRIKRRSSHHRQK